MNTDDLIVLASGGNGQREAYRGNDIGDDAYTDNGNLSSFNNLLSNNFNGYPLTYAGETRVGGFGGGSMCR